MTMNKIVNVSLLLCLFFVFSVQIQAKEKYIPESYQYTFTVGSLDFRGVVDGVEGTGALLYPIIINRDSKRAGIDFHSCFDSEIPHAWLPVEVQYDAASQGTSFIFRNRPTSNTLILKYPIQKAYISDRETKIEFPIIYISSEKTQSNAHWNGRDFLHNDTYLIPLRLVFEFTGHKVDWNPDTQEITVIYPAPETEE
jgi:hypothetical protein